MSRREIQHEKLICTECGWPRIARKPSWWSRPWVFAAVLTAAFLTYAAFKVKGAACHWGGEVPRFVEPGVSLADVSAALADESGEADARAADFARAVLRSCRPVPRQLSRGPMVIHAAFGPAAAPVDELWEFGWPSAWATGKATYVFDDAMNRTGAQAAKTNLVRPLAGKWEDTTDPMSTPPRRLVEMWGMDVVISPAPEQTGGVLRRWQVRLAGIGIVAATAVLMWFIAGLVAARRWRDAAAHRHVRRTQWLAATACIAGFVMMAGLTRESRSRIGMPQWISVVQQGASGASLHWLNEPCSPTGLTSADIERALSEPGGARRVLRAIVDAAPASGAPEQAFLALAVFPTAWIMPSTPAPNTWWPDVGVNIGSYSNVELTRHPLAAAPEPFETTPGWSARWLDGGITVRQDRGVKPTRSVSIGVEGLSVLLLGLCAITIVHHGALGWRPAMRRRKGLCPRCAYPLQEERAATPADAGGSSYDHG